jgi:hypothetical protein
MRISASVLSKIVLAVIVGVVTFWFVPKPLPELSRAEFMDEVRAGHVHRVEIEDQEVILGESIMSPIRAAREAATNCGQIPLAALTLSGQGPTRSMLEVRRFAKRTERSCPDPRWLPILSGSESWRE